MAQYTHLNIYKKSFDFLVYFGQISIHFQKEHRYTIGERILTLITDSIFLIYKANDAKENEIRERFLISMTEKLKYIDILIRLSCSLQCMSKHRYLECTKYTQEIEKQLSGWLGYTRGGSEKDKKGEVKSEVKGKV